MPRERPVFHSALGDYFISLRTARGWKQSQASDLAKRRGIPLGYQALRGLEEGKTLHPSRELLQAIAALYELPYPDLVTEVVRHTYGLGRDQTGHGHGASLAAGDVHAPASARLLAEQRAINETLIREVRDVTLRLTEIAERAILAGEARAAATPTPRSGKRRRAVGR